MHYSIITCGLLLCLVNSIYSEVEVEDAGKEKPKDLARGWGDEIDWVPYPDAWDIAKEQKKPIFILIHKTWCGACKTLKPMFAKAKELVKLSKYFIMVNVQDDEEPDEPLLKPDGNYIPRILFCDQEWYVLNDVINEKRKDTDNKYYYPDPGPILTSMKKVLASVGSGGTKLEL